MDQEILHAGIAALAPHLLDDEPEWSMAVMVQAVVQAVTPIIERNYSRRWENLVRADERESIEQAFRAGGGSAEYARLYNIPYERALEDERYSA